MLAGLTARGRAIGDAAADRARERLADELDGIVPGVRAGAEADAVVLSGRGLIARWIRDPRLRGLGGGAR